jgi:hypothetical protein
VRELEFLTRFGTTAGIRDLYINSGAMGWLGDGTSGGVA